MNAQTQTESTSKAETFDKAYVESLRQEAAKYRTEYNKFKAAQEEQAKKALEESGKFKELYEQTLDKYKDYDDLKAFFDEAQKQKESQRKEELKKLPDDLKKEFADLSLEKLIALNAKLQVQPPTSAGANVGTVENPKDPNTIKTIRNPYGDPTIEALSKLR